MRRFLVHLVTEIDFVDGDEAPDVAAQNYQKHLKETIQNAAQGLSPPQLLQRRCLPASGTVRVVGSQGLAFARGPVAAIETTNDEPQGSMAGAQRVPELISPVLFGLKSGP